MRSLQISVAIVGALLFAGRSTMTQQQTAPDHAKDRAAIEQTVTRFMDAWNVHDAHAFAMTFTEDADFTNVVGTHARGRANVESFHARVFATVFKNSHQTGEIGSIRFLTPELAAVDVDWQMTGATFPNGSPMPNRKGLLNWVMAKQADGSWLIEVMHNTESTDRPAIAK